MATCGLCLSGDRIIIMKGIVKNINPWAVTQVAGAGRDTPYRYFGPIQVLWLPDHVILSVWWAEHESP